MYTLLTITTDPLLLADTTSTIYTEDVRIPLPSPTSTLYDNNTVQYSSLADHGSSPAAIDSCDIPGNPHQHPGQADGDARQEAGLLWAKHALQ